MFFYIILLETFLYMVLVSLSCSSYRDKDVWLKSLDFFFVFPLNNGFSVIGVMRLDSRFAWVVYNLHAGRRNVWSKVFSPSKAVPLDLE